MVEWCGVNRDREQVGTVHLVRSGKTGSRGSIKVKWSDDAFRSSLAASSAGEIDPITNRSPEYCEADSAVHCGEKNELS